MTRDVIVPEANRRAYDGFHFAPGIRAGNLVLLSGQIGLDESGRLPDSVEEEFRNAWRSIGQTLRHAGLDFADIVEYTSYHVGLQAHLPTFMKVRDEFISAPWPAWTAIGISELAVPGARVEVKVVASS